jgi:hypothetical protein
MSDRIILCETPDGCTCGAPASTPAGMHHDHCPVNPAEPDGSGCRVCKIAPDPSTRPATPTPSTPEEGTR